MTQVQILRRFLEGAATREETIAALVAGGYRDQRGAEVIVELADRIALEKRGRVRLADGAVISRAAAHLAVGWIRAELRRPLVT